MMKAIMMIALGAAFLAGCNEAEKPKADGTGSNGTGSTAASAATAAAANSIDIPVEEDFEEDAEKAITPETLDAEIAALEKEIEAESDDS